MTIASRTRTRRFGLAVAICLLSIAIVFVATTAAGSSHASNGIASDESAIAGDADSAATTLPTFCTFDGQDATQHNIALTDYEVATPGDDVQEGDVVTVTFTLENVGQQSHYFSAANGVYVAAETPDGDQTYGHDHQSTLFDPGDTVTVTADLTVTAGSWTVWPAYETAQGRESPSPWHPCQFDVDEESTGGSGTPTPTPTPEPTGASASCTLSSPGDAGSDDRLSIAVGQPVTLDASGSTGGSVAEFDVDGDGRTDAVLQAPLRTGVTYDEPGTYAPTVEVRADASNGANDLAACGTVTVHQPAPPTAALDGPDVARTGSSILLDASDSSDPDGNVVAYRWDLDRDGVVDRTTSEPTTTTTYDVPGVHTAIVRVVDDDGFVASATTQVSVGRRVELRARLRAFPTVPSPGEPVQFSAERSDVPENATATYRWDFDGDGTVDETTAEPLATHAYDEVGTEHPVLEIEAVDEDGNAATDVTGERIYVAVAPEPARSPDERPDVTGFHRPAVDGVFYGHGGQETPADRAGEWSDGHVGPVTLRSADGETANGTVYLKQIGDELYLGLDLAGAISPSDVAGAVTPSDIDRVDLQLDRDDDAAVSDGDVQIEWELDDQDARGVGTLGSVSVFEQGRYVPVDPGSLDPSARGLLVPSPDDADDGGFELRLDEGAIENALGGQRPTDELTNVSFSVNVLTDEHRFGLVRSPAQYAENYGIAVSASTIIAGGTAEVVPTDDISIFDVEYTQSVQRTDNSLPVVRNKSTLVRVYVTHEHSEAIETDVELEAHRVVIDDYRDVLNPLDAETEYLGTESTTFDAPPIAFRTDLDDSATFELPASWTDVGVLRLEVSASRPGHVDETPANNEETVLVFYRDAYEPTIAVVPVSNSSFSPATPPGWWVNASKAGFRRMMPVGDVRYRDYGSAVLGDQSSTSGSQLIGNLKTTHAFVELTTVGPVDQTFGVTNRGGGLSDPVWGSGDSDVAWGSLASTSGRFIMVHEVQHNIGNNSYGRHVANTSSDSTVYGCGAAGPDSEWRSRYDDHDIHEFGWDPANGVVPSDHPDVMGYCTASNPRKWVSDYRWVRLTDRFVNYEPGNPVDPTTTAGRLESLFGDRGAGDSGSDGAGTDGAGGVGAGSVEPTTVRVVSGTLYANGTASLSPSFTTEGYPPDSLPAVQEPAALLAVEYDDETVHVPLGASFQTPHGEDREAYSFAVPVPDGDSVRSLRLVQPDNGRILDAVSPSDFTLGSATVETPEQFDRGASTPLDVTVDATSDRPLTYRLFYSPDGEVWYPYGGPFTDADDAPDATFTGLPGGESARFRVQVSDGLRTETVETDSFVVPHAPPDVTLRRGDRLVIEYPDDESTTAARSPGSGGLGDVPAPAPIGYSEETVPVRVTVGAVLSLTVDGNDARGDELPGSAYEWTVAGPEGTDAERSLGDGERLTTRFDRPGRYTVTVTATDPETGLRASDDLVVDVEAPALPPADTVDAFVDERGELGGRLPGDEPPVGGAIGGRFGGSGAFLAVGALVLALAAAGVAVLIRRDRLD